MSEFDVLYNNMHRTFPKETKSTESTEKSSATQEEQDSKKPESSTNPFKALFSKIF